MADKVDLTVRIILRSILPLFKTLYNEGGGLYKKLLSGIDGTIQFSLKGTETGAHLRFEDGVLELVQGVIPNPGVHIAFKKPEDMIALFTGGKGGLPSVSGAWRLGLLLKLAPLFIGLTLLMPDNKPKNAKKRELKIKLTMYMVTNALSQLNKGGEADMNVWTAKQPDRVYQLSVQPEGPAAYLRVKAGNSKSGHGLYTRKAPFIHMMFNGIDGAFKVMGEGKNTVKAMGDGDVRVEGSPEYAGTLGSFMVRVQDLLTPPAK
ncbi:MAG TPA: hypothetical protein VLM75_05990 [Spirochaetota bacterium]|nr:hypothetical protein [Spirochaetota bacterium]